MAAGYSTDYLLQLLVGQSVLTDEQAAEIRPKAPGLHARMQSVASRQGLQGEVTPAEVVAAFRVRTPDDRLLDEDRVMAAMAAGLGYPYQKIDSLKIDHELVATSLPRRFLKKYVVLPLRRDAESLTVAVDSPFNLKLVDDLQATTGLQVDLVLSAKSDILKTITEIFGFRHSLEEASASHDPGYDIGNLERLVRLKSENEIESSDQHVVKAVEYLLRYAFDQRASDLHIEPKREFTLVRMRIDGVLHSVHKTPKNVHSAMVSRIKGMARLDIAERRRPQDGRLKTDYLGREVELRISTMPVAFGEKVVIRIFDPELILQPLEEMGFYPKELALFRSFVARPHGIVLVTGPTGSGKTTTLYSALNTRATEEVNCVTIEDPVEMVLEAFNQVEVNVRAGITFAKALRTVLRQDPDIIMVGEIRDEETAAHAVQAAMTGHLVMSTLHTNDAASSITRLIDLGIEPFLVGSTLVAVVAQRLVRRVCSGCRHERRLSRDECRALGMVAPDGESPDLRVFEGRGCNLCRNTGLHGRVGVFEVMPITDAIRQLINSRADGPQILRQARQEGMMTLRECAIRRMLDGQTTFQEVLRVTVDAYQK
ncbi:MAG: general secretion pathway protein E [Myxococcota bacterium]|jgi:general secretion pathway protein E